MTLTDPFVLRRDGEFPGPWQVPAGGERGRVGDFRRGTAPCPHSGPGLHLRIREDEAAYVIEGMFAEQADYAGLQGPLDPM